MISYILKNKILLLYFVSSCIIVLLFSERSDIISSHSSMTIICAYIPFLILAICSQQKFFLEYPFLIRYTSIKRLFFYKHLHMIFIVFVYWSVPAIITIVFSIFQEYFLNLLIVLCNELLTFMLLGELCLLLLAFFRRTILAVIVLVCILAIDLASLQGILQTRYLFLVESIAYSYNVIEAGTPYVYLNSFTISTVIKTSLLFALNYSKGNGLLPFKEKDYVYDK